MHAARKELKVFAKLDLAPSDTKSATFTLDRRALAFWDDGRHAWAVEAGAFDALAGSSSADIRATFELTRSASFGGPGRVRMALSTQRATIDEALRAL